ncbi:DASH family cryptochrome [Olivibacter domesticus]|uniref:Cryptochrome DASH n=1 Tax=Olivibacter domesticus TaxID=407022 RepID=A0A1H7VDK1_OLID1|nr:DASH family cryptochrome [Olivibacter domesticus]SEM07150.1 deoxyribodipyrimidine photo-lyase [Olivibacter domesticus]
MNKDTILVWFRNDLRVHDNEILWQALERADKVVPVYIFDPRHYIVDERGLSKTGVIRAKFILESVLDLRLSLQALGADLLVASGCPEELLLSLAERYNVKEVYHHREVAEEETHVSTLVEESLWKKRLNLKHFIGHTLYHKEDLPFPIKDIPDTFATFRKKVERETSIRPTVNTPNHVMLPDDFEAGDIPTLKELGYTDTAIKMADKSVFKGGEKEALKQLNAIIEGDQSDQDNDFLMGEGTVLSPWIALGCLSAHTLYHTVKRFEERGLSKRTAAAIVTGLLWRDYFRFMFKKHGNRFFTLKGFSEEVPQEQKEVEKRFDRWKNGETGEPIIDAAMNQLNTIGFMPNVPRALAAHYLIHEMGVNHLLGAAYFEDKLIDYGPASNYGNWAHIAGVGSSVKDNGIKDIKKLKALFDPNGEYVKRWNSAQISLTD